MLEVGLIVDSFFSARKELARDMQESAIAKRIIEARSLSDGINRLETSSIHICVLGPKLSERAAFQLVTVGRKVSKNKKCAFVAVVDENSSAAQRLKRAGAHGTLQKPYKTKAFTKLVERAVEVALSGKSQDALPGDLGGGLRELQSLAISQNQLTRMSSELKGELSGLIAGAAGGIRRVAKNVQTGTLSLKTTGEPSLAARDALRLVLEQALGSESQAQQIGTFDHHFVCCLLDWFSDRVTMSHVEATEKLRKAFVEYTHRK